MITTVGNSNYNKYKGSYRCSSTSTKTKSCNRTELWNDETETEISRLSPVTRQRTHVHCWS